MIETEADTVPRVWVGCLACYNAGTLRGEWVDAIDAETFTPCHNPNHEEWWCFDHENFAGFLDGECSPLEASRLGRLLDAIEDDCHDVEAVRAWMDYRGERIEEWDAPTREAFGDNYYGTFESLREFAYEYVENYGLGGLQPVPEELFPYLDWGIIGRDLESSFYIHETKDYRIIVFTY